MSDSGRILFVGMGSIGLRNFESCRRLRPQATYAAFRKPHGGESRALPEGVLALTSLDAVKAFTPDMAWVCTPTASHLTVVQEVLSAGVRVLFVEKPLAHTSEDATRIAEAVVASGVKFFYGCLLRHHPLVRRMHELTQRRELGRALSYSIYCGSYLPDWRPGRDYREAYSAHAERGGGVTLDLIHEFDYAEFWFGPLRTIQGVRGHVSDLEISSDDVSLNVCVHESGVVGQVGLNYFRPSTRRDFEVIFSDGMVLGDLGKNTLEIVRRGSASTIESVQLDRDALHDLQTQYVFECVLAGQSGTDVIAVAKTNRLVLETQTL